MPKSFLLKDVRLLVIENGTIYVETDKQPGSESTEEINFSTNNELWNWKVHSENDNFVLHHCLCWEEPHRYRIPDDVTISILNEDVRLPKSIRNRLQCGASVWEAAVGYHREINAHHNYLTTNYRVAQEIALDFFSSALVSCSLQGVYVKGGHLKKAFSNIQTWTNYVNGTREIEEAVELVRDALFRSYDVNSETLEEEIPSKPSNVKNAKLRCASPILRERWRYLGGRIEKGTLLETQILKELIQIFLREEEEEATAKNVWMQIFPILFTDSEFGKWVMEVVFHKKLVVEFHQIVKGTPGYDVSDDVACNHDNDKYLPFQLVAYALKWYYGEEAL